MSRTLHCNSLNPLSTALVIIDIQDAFVKALSRFNTITEQAKKLTKGFNILNLPVHVTEQYPKGLGHTVASLQQEFVNVTPISKTTFSCSESPEFMELLAKSSVKQIVICGVETHVCINQSVHGLIEAGYQVHIPVDAVGSRFEIDYITALRKMEMAGAIPTTVETILFELIKGKESPHFKTVQKLIMSNN